MLRKETNHLVDFGSKIGKKCIQSGTTTKALLIKCVMSQIVNKNMLIAINLLEKL